MAEETKHAPAESRTVQPGQPEIHVIPDEFYGAALKADIRKEAPPQAPVPPPKAVPPAPKTSKLPAVLGVLVFLLLAGAGGAYFFRDALFPVEGPATVVETPPEIPPALPDAPTNVSATSTSHQSVSVSWEDVSPSESGFRIERRIGTGAFASVTSLPPNSTSFLDVSVRPEEAYTYRIVALGTTGESEPSGEASVVVQQAPPPPLASLPPAGLDADSDGITDIEEGLYGTKVQNQDSDGDSFLDGNEVFHLYNPAGNAPVRLLDSNLVKIMSGSVGWVISIPTEWTLTQQTAQGTRATVDSHHGETFVLEVLENPDNLPIEMWYVQMKGDEAKELLMYRSKNGYQGFITQDLLVTLIPWGDRVFMLTYNLNGQTYINFRTTYAMMLNSLELSGKPLAIEPIVEPLPLEPAVTSSEPS